ncbi:MAG: monofunctional biosynthetic peptidoglycan transglycosylase [Gammaproteobacteria bacterium]
MRLIKTILRLLLQLAVVFFLATLALVMVFKWVDPPTTSVMVINYLDARLDGQKKSLIKYQWVDYRDVSPYMPLALIAAEDQTFPFHRGFDFRAMKIAFKLNQRGRSIRGASTISQQVAKNLFLWLGRSYLRKGLEAYFTFLIETLWSKQRILEVYMNIAGMGNNVYGVGAASQYFFKKPVGMLTAQDAALLAAVLPGPSRLRAARPSPYVLQRQNWVLTHMNLLGGVRYLNNVSALVP